MPDRPGKLMPALYGGVIMGVISGLPLLRWLNCFCCAGVLLGGVMSVFFYKKDLTPESPPLTSSDSLQLGALAGLFGALVSTFLHGVVLASFGDVGSAWLMQILRSAGGAIPPEAMEQIENSMSQSSDLGIVSLVTKFFLSLVTDPLFGLLGGLIGYSFFKTKPGMIDVQPPTNPPAPTSM